MAVEDRESNDLLDYFRDVILMTAARLQSWTEEKVEAVPDSVPESCDDFGNELLECITGISPQEVHISVDVCYYQQYNKKNVNEDIIVLLHRLALISSMVYT